MNDKFRSWEAHENIKNIIRLTNRYIEATNNTREEFLHKVQFYDFLYDIYMCIIGEINPERVPDLNSEKEKNSDEKFSEKSEIITFLNEEVKILKKIIDPSWNNLRNYFEGFEDRIFKHFGLKLHVKSQL